MTSGRKILVGALVGAAVGWIVGEILADHFAPEYYTEEELEEMSRLLNEERYSADGQISRTRFYVEGEGTTEEKKMAKKTDYTKFYEAQAKPELIALAKKFNEGVVEEENEEEESWEYVDEDVDDDDDMFDLDDRNLEEIHILSREEWDSNDSGYKQVLLKYYAEDDILVDANDRALRSVERVVGPDALSNFGTFSDDENIVYVCNPKSEVEYQIIHINGAYSDTLKVKPSRAAKKVNKDNIVVHNVFEDARNGETALEEVDGDEAD